MCVKSLNELLRSHQQTSVSRLCDILRSHTSAVDASDTGTGKTFIGCAVATILQLPTLVVVPKIAVSGWCNTAEIFGEKFSVIGYEKLRTGNTLFGSWENQAQLNNTPKITFFCEVCQRKFSEWANCDPCPYNARGIHCFDVRKTPRRYGNFSFHPGVKLIIFDEAHRLGGLDSLNADMLFAAKRQGIKHLMLSATLAQSPLGFNAIGYSLDLHNGPHDDIVHQKPSFYRWASRYGVRRDSAFHGLKWFAGSDRQRLVMQEIRESIANRSVRVTCDEIPGFPDQEITAELYDIESNIDKIYAEMESAIRALGEKRISDKDPDHPLTKILRAQQQIEICKVPLALELGEDSIAKGFSVCFFCNFRQTVECLSQRFGVPFIDGTVTGVERERILAAYQSNELTGLVLNSAVGGVSINLQDLDGNHPRMGYVFPPWSATVFKQLCGRFRREGGKSKSHFRVLLAAGSEVERKIHRALQAKLDNLDALNDADLQPENLKL
jgi:Mimiviridae putative ATP-dependent RNA helicase